MQITTQEALSCTHKVTGVMPAYRKQQQHNLTAGEALERHASCAPSATIGYCCVLLDFHCLDWQLLVTTAKLTNQLFA